MINPDTPIEYRYLNMDTMLFVENELTLIEQIGKGGVTRAIPNFKCGQVLIAAGNKHFEEFDAIFACRTLCFGERFWVKDKV